MMSFKTKLNYFILLFFLIFSHQTFAQQLDHVQGEILVKLNPEVKEHFRTWMSSKRSINGKPTGVTYKKQISEPMGIHAISFDFAQVDEQELLNAINRDPKVQAAQFNHFVTLRSTIPDDPQFDQQWQYINTLVAGAGDLDADLAWDIATGGITADGDTIVACVIDDGVNLNHPDMAANLWKNYAEIPNNGIDDDNNGFVDDFNGWDTGSGTDNVGDGGGHGTPVAGIVGAKGNNGIGVAGVNWDVKLMIVQGGTGVESEVLEAYSYPLIARQRYNTSNGDEGAFVVSTNASWGINQGQPSNAPLWCAFYDTLGVHGILNCGATANADFNIDVVGDLPTACPSEYMIAVTNMNSSDVKVGQAGYGLETIDLGAFGADTWTTSLNSYSGFGGTSGATPHVTGTIALMYSAPCPSLISLAKSDPEAAAAQVRDYIFQGVDPNASLDGITVTGGRLNINNAMMNLMENCGPCPPPSAVNALDITDVTANLEWNSNDSILTSDVYIRPVGSMNWDTIFNVTSPYAFTDLMACTDYEVQITGFCNIDTSTTSVFLFKTDGCCENPSEFLLSSNDENIVSFTWDNVLAAQSYTLRISEIGMNDWTEINTTDLNYTFTNLESCTEYEAQIQVQCNGDSIGYTESTVFTTFGCGACLDLVYCETGEIDASEEWIDSLLIGDLVNVSGPNESYGNFTDGGPTAEFATYATYDFSLTPGYAGQNYQEVWGIWIDYNQDGDFLDADEEVYISPENTNEIETGSFEIPETAIPGVTRMRVIMAWNNAPSSCDVNSGFGEVEDYCITIVEGIPICDDPTNLAANNITTNSADLDWDDAIDASNYLLRHKKTSEMTWVELTVTASEYPLTNLDSNTEYEFQVKSLCVNGTETNYSESFIFTTLSFCENPENLGANNITSTSADLIWDNEMNTTDYVLRYKKTSETSWVEIIVATNGYALTDLDSNTEYEFEVKSNCTDGSDTDYSDNFIFMTLPFCENPENLGADNITTTSADLIWDDEMNASDYTLRYKKTSETVWNLITVPSNGHPLTDLDPDTEYEYEVRSICDDGSETDFSENFIFMTEEAVSTFDLDELQGLKIFPNPFDEFVNIQFSLTNPQPDVRIELLNQLGQIVSQKQLGALSNGDQQIQISTSKIPSGVYFLRIISAEGKSISRRIVRG